MPKILVADIGGTNSRFATTDENSLHLETVIVLENRHYGSFAEVFRDALTGFDEAAVRAVIAVAGPTQSQSVQLTNRDWIIDTDELTKISGLETVTLINDFEAQAHALPHLSADKLDMLRPGTNDHLSHKLIIGPGTGLGVASLVQSKSGWSTVPGEGGHVTLPIHSRREFDIVTILCADLQRVSAERILSGPGLSATYSALSTLAGQDSSEAEPPKILQAYRENEPKAVECLTLFATMLGRFVGDMALVVMPKSGIYIAGSLAQAVLRCTGFQPFLQAFASKGRVSKSIADIPVYLITDQHSGLLGAAASAIQEHDQLFNGTTKAEAVTC